MFWSSPKAPVPESLLFAHPYYPIGVEITNYVANDTDYITLLTLFGVGWLVILTLTWILTSTFCPRVKKLDKWVILWWVLTGTIHLFFEGYFALNHRRMGSAQDFFGQLWKEYAYSDSRYLWSEPFVLCMETITAVCWGPLSFLTAYLVATKNPYRYPFQALVTSGQIYGLILYYATSVFQEYYKGVMYSRPERFYYWVYFVFVNFIWIVIPGLLLLQSFRKTARAFRALDRMAQSLKAGQKNSVAHTKGHLNHA